MTHLRKSETRKSRPHSRADWKLLRPRHRAGANPAPLPAPGGGRKGWLNDSN